MSDLAALNLKEPDQVDWDNFNPGSKFQAPPPALDANGKAIVYTAQLPATVGGPASLDADDDGNLRVKCGPLKLVKNNNAADGYEIRFYDVSTRPFTKQTGEKLNVSSIGKLLRAAGSATKPQKNAEYVAAVKGVAGRVVPITLDWVAKNRDTGEEIKGYLNFPEDPSRPGQRKAILKAGDVLPSGQVVQSEVLFANARVRNVVDRKSS